MSLNAVSSLTGADHSASFATESVNLRPDGRRPWESLTIGSLVVDVGHVFKVSFPYRAVNVYANPEPSIENWSSVPIIMETNESFKIKYQCRAGGGSDYGYNVNGNCVIAQGGPAQRVRVRFDHIGRLDEIPPDTWINYTRDEFLPHNDFSPNRLAPKSGALEFYIEDIQKAVPNRNYTMNLHFIVEADF